MRRLSVVVIAALALAQPARAQSAYGAKGLFPVYETAGQWVIFDKRPRPARDPAVGALAPLVPGERFLVIGSLGAEVFEVARTSGTYGGACREKKPLNLRAALLKGPRQSVGRPIIAINVPSAFSLRGSRAVYSQLKNHVGESAYAALAAPIKQSAIEEIQSGKFTFKLDDAAGDPLAQPPKPEQIQMKIDFASRLGLKGLPAPFVVVEETQVSASSRRCLRLSDGEKLVGACAEMRRDLMAETALLQFVSYDPSGQGSPYVLAFTRTPPLWGDERWGFIVRESGPRLFLMDAMDVRCREGF